MPPFGMAARAVGRLSGLRPSRGEDPQQLRRRALAAKLERPAAAAGLRRSPSAASADRAGSETTEGAPLSMPATVVHTVALGNSHADPAASLGDSADSLFRDISTAVSSFLYGDGLASTGDADAAASPPALPEGARPPPAASSDLPSRSPGGDEMPSSPRAADSRRVGQPSGEAPSQDAKPPPPTAGADAPGAPEGGKLRADTAAERLAQALRSGGVSTLMLRNVPLAATQADLLEELDQGGFSGHFDFCYLPCAFETRANKGYAFVNFLSAVALERFVVDWHGSRRLGALSSDRALNVSIAAVQGLQENVKKWGARVDRIRNSELRPFIARPDGSPDWPQGSLAGAEDQVTSSSRVGLRPPPGLPPPSQAAVAPLGARRRRCSLPIGAPPKGATSARRGRF